MEYNLEIELGADFEFFSFNFNLISLIHLSSFSNIVKVESKIDKNIFAIKVFK